MCERWIGVSKILRNFLTFLVAKQLTFFMTFYESIGNVLHKF